MLQYVQQMFNPLFSPHKFLLEALTSTNVEKSITDRKSIRKLIFAKS